MRNAQLIAVLGAVAVSLDVTFDTSGTPSASHGNTVRYPSAVAPVAVTFSTAAATEMPTPEKSSASTDPGASFAAGAPSGGKRVSARRVGSTGRKVLDAEGAKNPKTSTSRCTGVDVATQTRPPDTATVTRFGVTDPFVRFTLDFGNPALMYGDINKVGTGFAPHTSLHPVDA